MEKASAKSVLVTGGAGFIGSHLVEALLEREDSVRVLDNFSTGKKENLEHLGNGRFKPGRDFEVIHGDIRDLNVLDEACAGAYGIYHQAALGSVPRSVEDPMTTQQVNADGTLNIFLAARKHNVSRVVYASSSAVYGDSPVLPRSEGSEGFPLSPYALTKRVNEDYARLFGRLYGLETVGLRYFNVYGPRQDPTSHYAAVIPRFVTALISRGQPVIYGDGLQSRDFTFVKDVVRANILAMNVESSSCGEAYNIGRGTRTTLLELLSVLQDLLNIQVQPKHDPPRAGDVMHSSADVSRARDALGFVAGADLTEGLGQSIEWYKKNL